MAKREKNEETSALVPAQVMDSEEALLACLEADSKGEATADEIREQMGSVDPRLERIEVKHAGACAFELPGGDLVKGETGIKCVVLASNFHNAKYAHAYDDEDRETDERPECKSSDGVTVDADSENQQADNCSICPLNCQATSQKARDLAFSRERGERCQNKLSLVVTLPGHSIPYILQLSARSFKPFASYAQRIGGQSRFLLHQVVTQITLKKVGQYQYSEARFANLGALPKAVREAYAEPHASYLAYLRRTATLDRIDEAEEQAKSSVEKEQTSESVPL